MIDFEIDLPQFRLGIPGKSIQGSKFPTEAQEPELAKMNTPAQNCVSKSSCYILSTRWRKIWLY